MLLKSLTAGVIMASLAGGAVYYGLGEELSGAPSAEAAVVETPEANVVEAKKSSKAAVEQMVGGRDDALADKAAKTNDTKTSTVAVVDVEPEAETKKKPKKRWLDEYLKSDDVDAVETTEAPSSDVKGEETEDVSITKATPKKLTVMKDEPIIKLEKVEETETVTVEEEILEDGRVKTTTTKKITVPGRIGKVKTLLEDIEITIDGPMVDIKTDEAESQEPLVKPLETEITVVNDGDKETEVSVFAMKPKATGRFIVTSDDGLMDILMSETEKLEIPDMRDQAYLNVVDYALSKNDRDGAQAALAKLSREELRDTARGRLAVSLAQTGKSKAAFAVLEELEIEELQGPIRLQIIEALTVGNLPGGNTWVEKN